MKMTEVTKLTKKNKNVLLTIVGVAIIAGGLFYWFQWRPSEIRKQCSQERTVYLDSELQKIKDGESEFIIEPDSISEYRNNIDKIKTAARKEAREESQGVYERCLSSKGLKTEVLVK